MGESFQAVNLPIDEMVSTACSNPAIILERLDMILGFAEKTNATTHLFTTVLTEAALRRAEEIQVIPEERRSAFPLYGVPFALKDNCDLAGAPTTCNSLSMPVLPATRSASLVQELEAAGAICIGKTTLSEFALGDVPAESPWPDAVNPVLPTHIPGSSSSGSAAAVAAGLVPFAIGTDTGGSIRNPAASMGLYGLKPTIGSIFLDGVFPLAPSLDTAGPITRTLEDLELVSRVLYPATWPADSAEAPGAVGFLEGFWKNQADADPMICAAMDQLREYLVSIEVRVIDVELPPVEIFDEIGWTILKYEAWQIHAERFETLSDHYHESLYQDLMCGKDISYRDYYLAKRKSRELRETVDRAFEKVDFLVSPTAYRLLPPLDDKDQVDKYAKCGLRMPFNVTGHPALATPLLRTPDGIPVAAQWAARQFAERDYFSRAFKFVHTMSRVDEINSVSTEK